MSAKKPRNRQTRATRKPRRFSMAAYLKKFVAATEWSDPVFDASLYYPAIDFVADVPTPAEFIAPHQSRNGDVLLYSPGCTFVEIKHPSVLIDFDDQMRKWCLERRQKLDAELRLLQQVSQIESCQRIIKKIERRKRSIYSRKQELFTAAKSQKVVRRKGTEQSNSRSGSQGIRTWVPATFESDLNVKHFLALNALLNHRNSNVGNGAVQSSSVIRGRRPTRRASRPPQTTLAHLQ